MIHKKNELVIIKINQIINFYISGNTFDGKKILVPKEEIIDTKTNLQTSKILEQLKIGQKIKVQLLEYDSQNDLWLGSLKALRPNLLSPKLAAWDRKATSDFTKLKLHIEKILNKK